MKGSGLGLEAQREAIARFAEAGGFELAGEFAARACGSGDRITTQNIDALHDSEAQGEEKFQKKACLSSRWIAWDSPSGVAYMRRHLIPGLQSLHLAQQWCGLCVCIAMSQLGKKRK